MGHLPEALFLSTASLCGPLLDSLVLDSRLLLRDQDTEWLFSLLGPPLGALSKALQAHSEAPEEQLKAPEDLVYPPLKALVDRLTEMDFRLLPTSLRGLLYLLTDCIDAERGKAIRGGLARVPGGPPNPSNIISAAAVSTCCQVVLSRLLATSLQLMRKETLAAAKGTDHRLHLSLEVPPKDAGKTVAEVSDGQVQRLFWDRRSLPSISIFSKALRHLGSFCWDSAVTALLLEEDKHLQIPEERVTEDVLRDIRTSLELHPDHRFFSHLAARLCKWMRRQMELPRLQSPLVFASRGQPQLGEGTAKAILAYIAQLDADIRNGSRQLSAGLTQEDLCSPHFDRLVALAVRAEAYTLPKTSAL